MATFLKANKALGQHFLTSSKVINKITQNKTFDFDAIIEVGPGPGVLTTPLSQHQVPLILIEKDQRFESPLKEVTPKVYIQDALEFPFASELAQIGENIWLVSNLPYNVSVPLTLLFLQRPQLKHLTLMYQKEVALRFLPAKNNMNSLLALSSVYFDIKKLVAAPPGAFSPPPKVESLVLEFHRKESPDFPVEEFSQLETFFRKTFENRRKQLFSVLKKNYPHEVVKEAFLRAEITATIRAEALELDQLLILYRTLAACPTL